MKVEIKEIKKAIEQVKSMIYDLDLSFEDRMALKILVRSAEITVAIEEK